MTLSSSLPASRSPPAPPRLLLINKFAESRAPELESLHSIISNRLNHDFRLRRDKRRRTTGFRTRKNNQGKSRRIIDSVSSTVGDGRAEGADLDEKEGVRTESKPSRRVRRRQEFKRNPDSGFCLSVDGTKRLRTHLWHAKRFTMVKRWGFYLPLGLQGRGKGSRAVFRRLKSGALVHDSSYSIPIQLEGPEESILGIMRMILRPFPSNFSEQTSKPVVHGACYANSMLHKVSFPLPKFIAPVIYMWRPLKSDQNCVGYSLRQLWIWIHPASYNEGFESLRYACEKQMNETGASVQCLSIEGHIARLEVFGSKSLKILQKVLIPVPESCKIGSQSLSSCSSMRPCSNSRLKTNFVLEHGDQLPPRAIFSLEVQDPRYLIETQIAEESAGSKDTLLSFWSKPEENRVFPSDNSKQLWDSYVNVKPPLPENIICSEKHSKRLKQFYLDSARSRESVCVARDDYDQSCPVIVLKHADHGIFGSRWSVILPLSWVKSFWMSLILNGAHAIGLREQRWIACNLGLPSFPFDFPDSSAYSSLMISESKKAEEAAMLRPPAVRPIDVPVDPPWHCVSHTLRKRSNSESGDCKHSGESFTVSIPRTLNDYNFVLEESCCQETGERPSFVRVLIHAFKEGSFEEGAVVCAPDPADVPACSSRLEEYAPLQMPQSFVQSYFTRGNSDMWELQVQQDCSTLQWYRWPIGFITSGFVRGRE
ncbi:hypothetical protein KSP39_PZI021643 [Platanthera zijinensis]|uniref:Uncharacterized protein n=1 Tax=Platanthera zijinensis TaxID=2320716 RepID=A0AAP0FW17_9ASPA